MGRLALFGAWVVVSGLLCACGEPANPQVPPPPPPIPTQVTQPAPVEPTWENLDPQALAAYVEQGATARLAEVAPELRVDRFGEHAAKPESGPELSGRASEQVLNLAVVKLARGELDAAEGLVRWVRARARNRNSAFTGTTLLCVIAKRRAGDDRQVQVEAIKPVLEELPRSRLGSATVVFQVFQDQKQLDARVEQLKQGLLSLDSASTALVFGQVLPEVVRGRAAFLEAVEAVRSQQKAQPPEPDFDFKTVDLAKARDTKPVVVGVWDLGTNTELFEKQLFRNRAERPNGKDDDGDGQVDDIGGLVDEAENTKLLFEPDPKVLEEYKPFLRGIMDLRAGIANSEAAQKVLALMRGVSNADELDRLEQSLDAVGEWAHGTHVAGIMLRGVPKAQLAVFRSAWAGEARPYHHRGPTDEELEGERKNMQAVARFINRHNVRVVNASLGFSQDYLESELRYEKDRYQDAAAVRARAKAVLAKRRDFWASVFDACPKTLFVVAAGNSNQDVVEYGVVPAGIQRDNLLVVGAVDRWGNWASFTNSGEGVQVFDFGVEVPSVIPSGETVPLSGTSMASPNVANLAAKILSVNSKLDPKRVKQLIAASAVPVKAPFSGLIPDEVAALAAARKAR
ncbi:MAG: S8 family serine peptidase [Myxococcales bacterium]|nr:S8 family serine peptidase [Myxococcales bacterium]